MHTNKKMSTLLHGSMAEYKETEELALIDINEFRNEVKFDQFMNSHDWSEFRNVSLYRAFQISVGGVITFTQSFLLKLAPHIYRLSLFKSSWSNYTYDYLFERLLNLQELNIIDESPGKLAVVLHLLPNPEKLKRIHLNTNDSIGGSLEEYTHEMQRVAPTLEEFSIHTSRDSNLDRILPGNYPKLKKISLITVHMHQVDIQWYSDSLLDRIPNVESIEFQVDATLLAWRRNVMPRLWRLFMQRPNVRNITVSAAWRADLPDDGRFIESETASEFRTANILILFLYQSMNHGKKRMRGNGPPLVPNHLLPELGVMLHRPVMETYIL